MDNSAHEQPENTRRSCERSTRYRRWYRREGQCEKRGNKGQARSTLHQRSGSPKKCQPVVATIYYCYKESNVLPTAATVGRRSPAPQAAQDATTQHSPPTSSLYEGYSNRQRQNSGRSRPLLDPTSHHRASAPGNSRPDQAVLVADDEIRGQGVRAPPGEGT